MLPLPKIKILLLTIKNIVILYIESRVVIKFLLRYKLCNHIASYLVLYSSLFPAASSSSSSMDNCLAYFI